MNEREQRLEKELKMRLYAGEEGANYLRLQELNSVETERARDDVPYTNESKAAALDADRVFLSERPPTPFPLLADDYGDEYEKTYASSDMVGIFVLGLFIGAVGVLLYVITRLPSVAALTGLGR